MNLLIALTLSTQPALAGARPFSPAYEGNCQAPRWSPDGTKLAYEVNYHDRKTVETWIQAPGQDPQPVAPISAGGSGITAGFDTSSGAMVVHELSWSPPSLGSYVYAASGADQDYDLYLSTGARIASAPGADGGAVWSPDGMKVAFTTARTGQGDVYLLDVNDLSAPPRQITGDPTASELYISWAPGSDKIAFVGHTRTGDNIYLVDDLDYPAPTPITTWSHTQTRPSFSSDGSQIAFYSNHEDPARFDLYVMKVGGQPRKLTEGVVMNARGPAWLPGTSDLIFVDDDDDSYDPVYRISAGGGAPARISTGTVGNGDHDVIKGTDGRIYLAQVAQGLETDQEKDFKRVYVMSLD